VGKLARKNFYENSKKGTIRKPNLQMFSSLLNYNGAGKAKGFRPVQLIQGLWPVTSGEEAYSTENHGNGS
jgi:hypothetical protein